MLFNNRMGILFIYVKRNIVQTFKYVIHCLTLSHIEVWRKFYHIYTLLSSIGNL